MDVFTSLVIPCYLSGAMWKGVSICIIPFKVLLISVLWIFIWKVFSRKHLLYQKYKSAIHVFFPGESV